MPAGNYLGYYAALRDAIRDKRSPPVTPAQATTLMAIIEAGIRSSEEGRVVRPDYTDAERSAWLPRFDERTTDVRMGQIAISVLIATTYFVGMIVLLEVGRRVRRRRHARHGDEAGEGLGAVEAAVFGLMGLLVAFTFSGAASRFDVRRDLIVEEANAIGTAYLRLDLLKPGCAIGPPATPPGLRRRPARGLPCDSRHHRGPRPAGTDGEAPTGDLGPGGPRCAESPARRVAAVGDQRYARHLDYPLAATQMHPPAIIFGLLALVALVCALLAGYAMAAGVSRSWIHIIGFAAVLSIAVYVIVDLEYPRLGLFKISDFDRMLVDVRASMR